MIVVNSFFQSQLCAHAATAIVSQWRCFRWQTAFGLCRRGKACLNKCFTRGMYIGLILKCLCFFTGVIACQSVHRMNLAMKTLYQLKYNRSIAYATAIQSRYRALMARRQFLHAKCQMILIQSHIRRWTSERYLDRRKKACTKISCQWRMVHQSMRYSRKIQGV